MRIALAVLLALHGVAHLVGFVGSWQLAGPDSSIPYKTTILSGRLNIGGPGVRAMGVFWLLTAVAFVLTAVGALTSHPWWTIAALSVTLFSLTLCIVALPETRIGVAVNVFILAALLFGQQVRVFTTMT